MTNIYLPRNDTYLYTAFPLHNGNLEKKNNLNIAFNT